MYNKIIVDGYFYRTMHYHKRLAFCPYGSAGVNEYNSNIHLISYRTRVISIDREGWLECTGTYSATTRKHIAAFLREYAPSLHYYDAKRAAAENIQINIYTGATRPLP